MENRDFHVTIVQWKHHFLEVNNDAINHLSLPALKPLNKRARMDFANESRESQVSKLLRPTPFFWCNTNQV